MIALKCLVLCTVQTLDCIICWNTNLFITNTHDGETDNTLGGKYEKNDNNHVTTQNASMKQLTQRLI